jgi:hypothetical protein
VSENPRERLAKALNAALADDQSQALRERIAREVPAALALNGHRLLIHHEIDSNAAGMGFATAILMAAELGEGAQRMYAASLWYPGAALIRQLIEGGYLLTLMSESEDEAATWMLGKPSAVAKRFAPGQLRDRAVKNFRPTEYKHHCNLGGHPNPAGRVLLRRRIDYQPVSSRAHWLDLGEHLADAWAAFVAALPLYDPRMKPGDPLYGPNRSPESGESIEHVLADWRQADQAGLTASVPEMVAPSG